MVSSESSPASSKRSAALKAMTSGLGSTYDSTNWNVWRRASCARAVPKLPVLAPMIATGLWRMGVSAGGRDTQSRAFFSTPGMP